MNRLRRKEKFRKKYEKLWEAEKKYRAFMNHHLTSLVRGGITGEAVQKNNLEALKISQELKREADMLRRELDEFLEKVWLVIKALQFLQRFFFMLRE